MAGFLDFCMGAYIAQTVLHINNIPWSWWPILVGGFFALLPDVDIAFQILRGRVEGNHRASLMHMPLLVVPAAVAVAWMFGGSMWALIALLCLLWHYLHDTVEGVKWCWPLSQNFFCFRGRVLFGGGNHQSLVQKVWLVPNDRTLIEWSLGCVVIFGVFPDPPPPLVNNLMLLLIFVPFIIWGSYWLYNKKATPQ